MKHLFIIAMLSTGMVFTAKSQEEKQMQQTKESTPEELATKHTEKMTTELTLTPEQKTKFYTLDLNRINKVRPLREKLKGSTTPEERKTIHKEINTIDSTFDNDVNAMLTPEQQEKWKVQRNKIKENRMSNKVVNTNNKRPVPND